MRIEEQTNMADQIDQVFKSDEVIVCDMNMHEFHTYEPKKVG